MKIEQFRQARSEDLKAAARALESVFKNDINTSPIILAAEDVKTFSPNLKDGSTNQDYWGYTIDNLVLPVSTTKHLRPKGIKTNNVELSLGMKLIGDFKHWDNLSDPFVELSFNVAVRGVSASGSHYFCFHIDKHDMSKITEEPHPIYHLQYSSNPNDEDEFDYGSTFHLDTPRILHHPVDFILGIGFLTNNFFPMAYDEIMDDTFFPGLYKRYQERIIKPYFHTLANYWDFDRSKVIWNPVSHLCPTFL